MLSSKIEKFLEFVIKVTNNIGAIFLAIAFVLVFYQVVTRFVFNSSSAWSEILARAFIIWTVFTVLGPAIRLGRMIPIDAVRHLFSQKSQIWFIRIVTFAVTLFLIILIWFGTQMTIKVYDQQVALINISISWFYVAIPIGSLAALAGVFLAHKDAEVRHKQEMDQSK